MDWRLGLARLALVENHTGGSENKQSCTANTCHHGNSGNARSDKKHKPETGIYHTIINTLLSLLSDAGYHLVFIKFTKA